MLKQCWIVLHTKVSLKSFTQLLSLIVINTLQSVELWVFYVFMILAAVSSSMNVVLTLVQL
jgi:hypothetical protein